MWLALSERLPARTAPSGENLDTRESALEQYLEPWRDRVPHGAVGALVSLLGNGLGGSLARLAEQWCGDDISVDQLRAEMVGDGEDVLTGLSVWVSPQVARGDRVVAVNLLGADVEMAADEENETLFAVDPMRTEASRYSALAPLGAFWEVRLRAVALEGRTTQELLDLLGSTVDPVGGWLPRIGAGRGSVSGGVGGEGLPKRMSGLCVRRFWRSSR